MALIMETPDPYGGTMLYHKWVAIVGPTNGEIELVFMRYRTTEDRAANKRGLRSVIKIPTPDELAGLCYGWGKTSQAYHGALDHLEPLVAPRQEADPEEVIEGP